ncbi:3-hydroxy-3-methylglutaryl-coenzyme A reductase [Oligella ureolytica]|uniref:3-hydroxy-3-methylglutaryl coenzyme A reductase n=2 Tax=Oligella ureolytica TaxID=90244 RepID=A0A378XEN9_9BURK|nr:hydroxymethylglutaryl-CoA reductase, degradative [Oligella ureolytica]SUA51501.1 3-hydroxy-3-methylglutaryl-coenzyme A reductase [Oligella ureolytica]
MNKSSRISGFHKMNTFERLNIVKAFSDLDDETIKLFENTGNLPLELADNLVENVIGTMNIPLGIATNMKINGRDTLIPMATEESSVVAAVCNASRQCYDNGGFSASMSGSLMIAQIQLVNITNPEFCKTVILEKKEKIREICNACDPILVSHGGGFKDLEIRVINSASGAMVITHIIVDTRDAMGANAVNTMAEKLAPEIEHWTDGKVYLRILSNLADKRLARARATWTCESIGGEGVRDGIISAYEFANHDPYRAATHNKGIMNGISAVVLATGNDTRAVEAGAHAYATRQGSYRSLTHWEKDKYGNLVGSIEVPMAVGLIGGATKLHPIAKANLEILDVQNANQLAEIIAAVGLAQNFSALKSLATVGIQKGHMSLHAQNIAMMAGAIGDEVEKIAKILVDKALVRIDIAQEELTKLRSK